MKDKKLKMRNLHVSETQKNIDFTEVRTLKQVVYYESIKREIKEQTYI
jgi:hypothetical protein